MLILALSSALWVLVAAFVMRVTYGSAPRLAPALVARSSQGAMFDGTTRVASTAVSTSGALMHLAANGPASGHRDSTYDGFSSIDDRPLWMRVGLGSRPPEPPVVGRAATIRWWERARSAIGLVILVIFLAALFLATLGALAWSAGFLLERAI